MAISRTDPQDQALYVFDIPLQLSINPEIQEDFNYGGYSVPAKVE